MVIDMKAKLIALFAAALIVVGAVAVAAVASPDGNGTKDSSSKNEKQIKNRDKSLDKVRGVREDSKSDGRQDARIGDEKSWDDAGYDDSRYDGAQSDDGDKDDVTPGATLTTTPTLTSFDDSGEKAGRDKDSRHKKARRPTAAPTARGTSMSSSADPTSGDSRLAARAGRPQGRPALAAARARSLESAPVRGYALP